MAATSSPKRQVPEGLQKVLKADKEVSKTCYDWFDQTYGLVQYRHVLMYLEYSCHGIPWLAINIAMLYLAPSQIQLWMNLLLLLVLDLVIVAIIKAFVRRRRPSYNVDDMRGTVSVDKFSFPSGHATRAVAVTGFFSALYPIPILSMAMGPWAASVVASRVMLGRHHVLDVMCGTLIGLIEVVLMGLLWVNEDGAKSVAALFTGEDPWSNA